MSLIDGDKLQEFPIRATVVTKNTPTSILSTALRRCWSMQSQLPTVDAEVVTRCKDCKHSWEDIDGPCCGYGPLVDCIVPEDFFCAYGKPKEV